MTSWRTHRDAITGSGFATLNGPTLDHPETEDRIGPIGRNVPSSLMDLQSVERKLVGYRGG